MNKTLFFIENGTVIGIPLSFNWDTMSIILNKIPDFTDKYFKNYNALRWYPNILTIILCWNWCHCSSYFHDLGYLEEFFVHCVYCFLLLQVPSINIKINCNECIYIGENNENWNIIIYINVNRKKCTIARINSWTIHILSKPNFMCSFNNPFVGVVPYFVSYKFYTP